MLGFVTFRDIDQLRKSIHERSLTAKASTTCAEQERDRRSCFRLFIRQCCDSHPPTAITPASEMSEARVRENSAGLASLTCQAGAEARLSFAVGCSWSRKEIGSAPKVLPFACAVV